MTSNRKRLLGYVRAQKQNSSIDYRDLEEYGVCLTEEREENRERYTASKRDITEEEFWTLKKVVDTHLEAGK